MATVTCDLGTERELEPELDSHGWLDARGVIPGQDRRPISTNPIVMVTVPQAAGSPGCALQHESPGLTRTVTFKSDSLLVGVSLSLSLFNNIDLAANLTYQY